MPDQKSQGGGSRPRYPKVKTGCITCRNRRVKCDETHPQCKRCIKYGTECEGYLPGRRRPPSSAYGALATQARALVPKSQTQPQNPALVFIQPFVPLFDSEQDHRYFTLFSDRIATEICPYFDPEKWTRLILQACAAEPSIRHAAIAIGALGRTYQIAQLGKRSGGQKFIANPEIAQPSGSRGRIKRSKSPEEIVTEAGIHHRRALEQYDKAIKRMRNDVFSGNQNLRTTLLICIIIICFEAIHGNHESAAGQLQSGLALIQDWKSRHQTSEKHPQGFSSPAPDVVEDFLVQVFGRMEIQSMSVFDPRPVEIHKRLRHEGKDTIAQMPKQFTTLDQARVYLDLITRRLMHFNSSIHVPRASDVAAPPNLTPPMPGSGGQNPNPMPWIDGRIPLELTESTLSSQPILAEHDALMNELDLWKAAFKPLLITSSTLGGRPAISALTLSVSALASQISLQAALFINETAYDILLPEFKAVVDQVALILGIQRTIAERKLESSTLLSPSPSPARNTRHTSPPPPPQRQHNEEPDDQNGTGPMLHFAFDIGVIPPLYLVIVKCRNRALRHQALSLLRANPRREGVWDSVSTVALGRWVVGLEESGTRKFYASTPRSDDGSDSTPRSPMEEKSSDIFGNGEDDIPIPEDIRVRKAAMRFDLLERRANMHCLQMDVDKRIFVRKTQVFTW